MGAGERMSGTVRSRGRGAAVSLRFGVAVTLQAAV